MYMYIHICRYIYIYIYIHTNLVNQGLSGCLGSRIPLPRQWFSWPRIEL